MPCYAAGHGHKDEAIARRRALSSLERPCAKETILKNAFSVLSKWLLTRPSVFGLAAYPFCGGSSSGPALMDSAVATSCSGSFRGPRLV